MRHWLAIVSCAWLAGCGGETDLRTSFKTDQRYPPRPAGHEIELLSEAPQRPYVEIAVLEGDDNDMGADGKRMLVKMRQRARELGGDAIVGFKVGLATGDEKVSAGVANLSQQTGSIQASGIVIRWKN